jgi:signal transduction histidine kinase
VPCTGVLKRYRLKPIRVHFALGAYGGLVRILMPSAVNTASNGLVNWPARFQLRTALAAAPVTADPNLAESLVANLLDNAIRHNVPGGDAEISTALTTTGAVISVSNTGPPVPPDAVEDLFQPFRQLGTQRTRRGQGHGLGLAIVRAIADTHGAALTARARPEGGLDIEVTFPPASAVQRAGVSERVSTSPAPH